VDAGWGLPEAASDRAPFIGNLWSGAWIASMVIGVLVWGLIGYAIIRFRRRSHDETPKQTQYHLPMEILYTLVPFLIIGVLFFFTVQAQNGVLAKTESQTRTSPDRRHRPEVVVDLQLHGGGQPRDRQRCAHGRHHRDDPDLYLPLNKPVRFNLQSADVIHSFWVPDFYFKLDVIPGHPNSLRRHPDQTGHLPGQVRRVVWHLPRPWCST
jgi:cytochrome c oxidase subunit 2